MLRDENIVEIKRPEYLYHFTLYENFTKIIDSGTLWLKNIKDQKDSYELKYGAEIAFAEIHKLFKYYQTDNNHPKLLGFLAGINMLIATNLLDVNKIKMVYDLIDSSPREQDFYKPYLELKDKFKFFICSFSKDKKNEYLWREYAAKSTGVCLCLNTLKLIEYNQLNPNKFQTPEVLYYPKNELKMKFLHFMKKEISKLKNKGFLNDEDKLFKLLPDIITFCTSAKKTRFEVEKEYRIVYSYINGYDNFVKIKNKRYINLPIEKAAFYDSIEKIILGADFNFENLPKINKIAESINALIYCNSRGMYNEIRHISKDKLDKFYYYYINNDGSVSSRKFKNSDPCYCIKSRKKYGKCCKITKQ